MVPGRTLSGKSSLVLALVKAGADYYSDEYAVFDGSGRVHPYSKPLSRRSGSGPPRLRGTPLDEVLTLTMNNGSQIQLDTRGGAIVSRVRVEDSVPQIEEQVTSPGYAAASHVGSVGDPVGSMSGLNLSEGTTVYVVEVFYERPMLTSITGFFSGTIPDVMYDRAIF